MRTSKREIIIEDGTRYVDGMPVHRDADFGVLVEKRGMLDAITQHYDLDRDASDHYVAWDREHVHFQLPSGAVVTATNAQGPAYAATGVERLIRHGVSHIVLIGTCGSIVESIAKWSHAIIERAIIDEGTSRRYVADAEIVLPDGRLTSALVEALTQTLKVRARLATIVTNDARFREDPKRLHALWMSRGAELVDMESSAGLIVARYHDLPAAAIRIVVDQIADPLTPVCHKTLFVGRKSDQEYSRNVARCMTPVLEAVAAAFESFASSPGYPLLIHQLDYDPALGGVR